MKLNKETKSLHLDLQLVASLIINYDLRLALNFHSNMIRFFVYIHKEQNYLLLISRYTTVLTSGLLTGYLYTLKVTTCFIFLIRS